MSLNKSNQQLLTIMYMYHISINQTNNQPTNQPTLLSLILLLVGNHNSIELKTAFCSVIFTKGLNINLPVNKIKSDP